MFSELPRDNEHLKRLLATPQHLSFFRLSILRRHYCANMEKTYRYSTRKQKSVSYLEPTYSELDDTANESDEDDIKPKKRVKLSKQFHFLKLPQEIQDKVHRYALVPARGVALALEGSELNQKLIRSSYRLQGRVVTLPYYGLSRWVSIHPHSTMKLYYCLPARISLGSS